MDNTQENLGSIYVQEGQTAGMIAEPAKAEELAYLEKPTRDIEIRMEKEAQMGMTEQQKKNVELMEGVESKYPDGFIKIVDSKGDKFLITHGYDSWSPNEDRKLPGESLVISKYGVVAADTRNFFGVDNLISAVNWDLFNDQLNYRTSNEGRHWEVDSEDILGIKKGEIQLGIVSNGHYVARENNTKGIKIRLFDINIEEHQRLIKPALEQAERLGKEKKVKEQVSSSKPVSQILANL